MHRENKQRCIAVRVIFTKQIYYHFKKTHKTNILKTNASGKVQGAQCSAYKTKSVLDVLCI